MDKKHYIELDGIEYQVKEPTIEIWSKLQVLKDLYEPEEFSLALISIATGLTTEQIRGANWYGVYMTSNFLADYFLEQGKKFYNEFEYKDVTYRFIDLENLTFGEFIDLDEFLSRDLAQRNANLNLLMALLYREVVDGVTQPYDASLVTKRAEHFKGLPVKYLNGAFNFFFHLENILRENTRSYLVKRVVRRLIKGTTKVLRVFGGGIQRLYTYLMKIYSKSKPWLKRMSKRFSTFLHIWRTWICLEKEKWKNNYKDYELCQFPNYCQWPKTHWETT